MYEAGLSTQSSGVMPARNAEAGQNALASGQFAGMKTGGVPKTVLHVHLPVFTGVGRPAVVITLRVVTVHISPPLLRLDEAAPASPESPEGKEKRPDSSAQPGEPDGPDSPRRSGEPIAEGCPSELSDELCRVEDGFRVDDGSGPSERGHDKGADPSIGNEDTRKSSPDCFSIEGGTGEALEGEPQARQPGDPSSGSRNRSSEQPNAALPGQMHSPKALSASLVDRGVALYKGLLQLTASLSPVAADPGGFQLQAGKPGLSLRSESRQPVSPSGEKPSPQLLPPQLTLSMSGQPVMLDPGIRVPSQVIPLEPSKLSGREGTLRKKEKSKKDKWKKGRQARNYPGDHHEDDPGQV